MSDEEDEETTTMVAQTLPIWKFSAWDIVGAALHGVGVAFSGFSQASMYLAQAAAAHANWERQNYELAQVEAQDAWAREAAEAEMAEILNLPEAEK